MTKRKIKSPIKFTEPKGNIDIKTQVAKVENKDLTTKTKAKELKTKVKDSLLKTKTSINKLAVDALEIDLSILSPDYPLNKYLRFGHYIPDQFSIADNTLFVLDVEKVTLELKQTEEQLSFDMSKPLFDTAIINNPIALQTNKPFSDTFSSSDELIARMIHRRVFSESVSYQELVTRGLYSTKLDTANTNEITKVNLSVIKLDQYNSLDQASKVFGKATEDTFSYLETVVYYLIYRRVFSDTFSNVDENSKLFGKIALESSSNEEEISKAVESNKLDSTNHTEVFNLSTAKVLSDTYSRVEEVSLAFSKIFSDTTRATDDFYGQANVDDDQTARVDKVVKDQINSADVFSRIINFNRLFGETTNQLETISLSLDKSGIVDTYSSIDSILLSIGYNRSFADQANNSDLVTNIIGKTTSLDTASSTDELSRIVGFIRNFSDTSSSEEQMKFDSSKVLLDNYNAIDQASKLLRTSLTTDNYSSSDLATKQIAIRVLDIVSAIDEFTSEKSNVNPMLYPEDLPNVSDIKIINLSKPFYDVLNGFSETITLSNNKGVVENINPAERLSFDLGYHISDEYSISDTGGINKQNYFLESYTEFGYVGEIYTF